MEKIKQYIFKQIADERIPRNEAREMLREFLQQEKVEDDIAIIGIAGRYPDSDDLEAYWYNLKHGVNCISRIPEKRREDCNQLYSLFVEQQGKMIFPPVDKYRIGGYLSEIDQFDPAFFQIPPNEAKAMDPFQRLFLETVYVAIEDAGYSTEKLSGAQIGVFAGRDHVTTPYYQLFTSDDHPMKLTGSYTSILASRISYLFNFRGPSLVIDTACSSGLIAIHKACQSLRNKECLMAIAGGISLDILPATFKAMNMMTSSNHKMHTFSQDASGSIFAEGVGAVLLKPLKSAIKDGDHIHAVIKGSAANNDGASNGISAPNRQAQEDLLVEAWKNAKVSPESVSYIEAHGTATYIGDPIEIKAIAGAFQRYSQKRQFCAVGASKTNIGHTVAASGVASLTKVILALQHECIPPSINFTSPNQHINFIESPIYVNDKLKRWERTAQPRRAGISSFGFSGTNCHIVVEEAPLPQEKERLNEANQDSYVFLLSAKNKQSLSNMLEKYKNYLTDTHDRIDDICYTSAIGRNHYQFRLAFLIQSKEELSSLIERLLTTESFRDPRIYMLDLSETLQLTALAHVKKIYQIEQKVSKEGRFTRAVCSDICRAYAKGQTINWEQVYEGFNYQRVKMPTYSFQYSRCWFEPHESGLNGFILTDTRCAVTEMETAPKSNDLQEQGRIINVSLTGKGDNTYTPIEQAVGNIWGDVLGFAELDVHEHFYSLGGSSIFAIRLIEDINAYFKINLAVMDLLNYPSVFDLSEYLSGFSEVEASLGRTEPNEPVETVMNATNHQDDAVRNEPAPYYLESFRHLDMTNHYSWSQLDCYERGLAILCEKIDHRLIKYLLFMLGGTRGLDLTEIGLSAVETPEQYVSNEDLSVVDEVLRQLGLKTEIVPLSEQEHLCDTIIRLVESGQPTLVLFDEYYVHYSNFYKVKHTNHLTVVNGYDYKRKLFHIVNHCHIADHSSPDISYSPFSVPFDVIEEIYRERQYEHKKAVVLNQVNNEPADMERVAGDFLRVLEYVAASKQKGRALGLLEDILKDEDRYFVEGNLTKLYSKLGGLELMVKVLLREYQGMNREKLENDCFRFIQLSAGLINRYSASVYRKKIIKPETLDGEFKEAEELMGEIFTEFYNFQISYLTKTEE
ncbi:hypothetical protein PMSD_25205 [Paenibacillus macquariensis subsp. defensor]|nr:hypothetical protein PMSD_25205 [Paenibacillus macquariensis subsp. defensor]